MHETRSLIETKDLAKTYGDGESAVAVLKGINTSIEAGERVALLGKSGSGKSTFLHLIGGLDIPTSGEIRVAGRDLATLSRTERADYRRDTIGMIFQSFYLVPQLSSVENVEMPLNLLGIPRSVRRKRATTMLEWVGMGHRLRQLPNTLSGGERQRVAIARALIHHPRLILADEPTGNLDSANGKEVIALLSEHLAQSKATLVMVTHDQELAQRCATRIVKMQDGLISGEIAQESFR